ncbi:hypothetical protein [Ramlibacter sp.]|uniref:hypothetical protein n=1 Tax=Ramlibacter sp. TaxID=1917967 RepID=UPI0017EC3038|nr:hypothetical protein [Ramlibacter sp.]MBA2675723.1 hypothetical protein [Ramlibacter sp.]
MSFDLPLTAFALESSGTQPAVGAVHTLTVPSAGEDEMQALAPADAAPFLLPGTSVLAGDPPPWITITF